jgi:hypothetical protein
MEVNPILFWNGLLTLVIAPAIWVFRGMFMHDIMDAMKRLEDKLDKILIGK